MATVNFSIPDDVKTRFNAAFEGCNKSAIVAELMEDAIRRAEARQQNRLAVASILARRQQAPAVSADGVREARESGRP